MNVQRYITLFALGTALAWAAFVVVLLNMDPVSIGILGFLMFYATLFVALVGVFTTAGTFVRTLRRGERSTEEIITTSIRQAFLFAIIFEGSVFLLSKNLLNWWTLLLTILLCGFIEYFVISVKQNSST